MSDVANSKYIMLAMPGYGRQTASAGRSLWRASRDMDRVDVRYRCGSLLANNFNALWCSALNACKDGEAYDYVGMLHDDIGAPDFWLDDLIEELDRNSLDVLGVVSPIKDTRGRTSIALDGDDNWRPKCRLTMREIHRLPETFTSRDVGFPLLINTGCWVCRFNPQWARLVHFEINDRIVIDKKTGNYEAQVEPEDWFFSRLLHELELEIGVTRKIPIQHRGELDFTTATPWGQDDFDTDALKESLFADWFPETVMGWLTRREGKELAKLAEGKRVLEIGSYCGRSTICLARTAKSVTAVDYFDGRSTPVPMDTRMAFLKNVGDHHVRHKITLASPHDDLPADYYDLAFVDGAHDRESVTADIETCLAALKPDGVIVFHDYASRVDPGVTSAVDKFVSEGATILDMCDSMAVVKPPVFKKEKEYV